MSEQLDLQHRIPELVRLGKSKIREMLETPVRDEIASKYPEVVKDATDLIIELLAKREQIAEKKREIVENQKLATAENNPGLESEISVQMQESSVLEDEEKEIEKKIDELWWPYMDKYPELTKWRNDLEEIAKNAEKNLLEKFGNN